MEWNRSAHKTDIRSCEVGNEHLHISWNSGNFTSLANKYQIAQKASIPMETAGNVVNSRGRSWWERAMSGVAVTGGRIQGVAKWVIEIKNKSALNNFNPYPANVENMVSSW